MPKKLYRETLINFDHMSLFLSWNLIKKRFLQNQKLYYWGKPSLITNDPKLIWLKHRVGVRDSAPPEQPDIVDTTLNFSWRIFINANKKNVASLGTDETQMKSWTRIMQTSIDLSKVLKYCVFRELIVKYCECYKWSLWELFRIFSIDSAVK